MTMDARSEANLVKVHPALCNVIRGAAQTPQAFEVTYGLRTLAAEKEAVASGHSQTLHSRHLPNKDGVACAVDVNPVTNGVVNFAKGHELEVYGQIWKQIKASADALKIEVEWGGNWHSFKDWEHFQLPWNQYP